MDRRSVFNLTQDLFALTYREALRYWEQAGNLYNAALARFNVAIAYMRVGRFNDALLFAQAALSNFEQFGPAAVDKVAETQQLIAEIEQLARGKRST